MSDTIGAALRTARGQRRLTLQQVSEATRIRVQYLQALENDDLSAMTSAAQARGFMRIYAQFLELDLESLIPQTPAGAVAEAGPAPGHERAASPLDVDAGAGKGDASPGLLAGLRGRLLKRFGGKAPSPTSEASTEPATAPDSTPKKKALR